MIEIIKILWAILIAFANIRNAGKSCERVLALISGELDNICMQLSTRAATKNTTISISKQYETKRNETKLNETKRN